MAASAKRAASITAAEAKQARIAAAAEALLGEYSAGMPLHHRLKAMALTLQLWLCGRLASAYATTILVEQGW